MLYGGKESVYFAVNIYRPASILGRGDIGGIISRHQQSDLIGGQFFGEPPAVDPIHEMGHIEMTTIFPSTSRTGRPASLEPPYVPVNGRTWAPVWSVARWSSHHCIIFTRSSQCSPRV